MLHPNHLFHQYREKIKSLSRLDRETILTPQFEITHDADLTLYYAPHNEYINEQAKILIVGITPGWSQTLYAFQTAKNGIEQNLTDEEICFQCKMNSRFAGTMRKNLISMLDELNLQTCLNLPGCEALFLPENRLLHTTSLIKYPCFYKGKNYSGHTPAISNTEILKRYIQTEFSEELHCLDNVRLIIPLGSAVERVFRELYREPFLRKHKILWGFPHPSGLNARRTDHFRENRETMLCILNECGI